MSDRDETVLGKQTVAIQPSACPERGVDARAGAWARTRQGLIVPADVGMSRSQRRTRVDRGQWEPLHPGVLRDTAAPRTDDQRLLAACEYTGGIASHRAALWLWELCAGSLEVVEVTVTRPHAPRPTGVVVHRSLDVASALVSRRRGIPVTTPLRTLVDAGAVLPKLLVASALDVAVARRLVSAGAAEAEVARLSKRGRRGVGVLRSVLEERDCVGRHPSVLEAKGIQLVRRGTLPLPHVELIAGPNGEFRLDFAWENVLLAWELDGWEWHSSYEAVRRGKARNNTLVGQGWAILQHDWFDIVRRPTAVLAEVTAVYRERLTILGTQTVE